MDPALAVVISAIVSSAGGALVLYLGRKADDRYGLPSDFETSLLKHRKEYTDLLTSEVEARKMAQADCESRLALSEDRERSLLRRMDDAEATILRLRSRLGDS